MLQYQQGLGNHFESEAIADALPRDQNCPQKAPFGLYTEQLSGSAFTVPQKNQLKTWLYRLRPSVVHEPFVRAESSFVSSFGVANDHDPTSQCVSTPNQLRWSPFPIPTTPLSVDFVQGLSTVCGAGDPSARDGMAIYVYACNADMTNKAMYNSDGEFLVVPQAGKLMVDTEMGKLEVAPGEIFGYFV